MSALRPATVDALAEGRRLFNRGQFFEAHEVWEEAWLAEEGETRQLLQGLIQVAAGFHQAFDLRRPGGCARLLEAGWNRLRALSVNGGGLALGPFCEAVALSLEKARGWDTGGCESPSREEAPLLHAQTE